MEKYSKSTRRGSEHDHFTSIPDDNDSKETNGLAKEQHKRADIQTPHRDSRSVCVSFFFLTSKFEKSQ